MDMKNVKVPWHVALMITALAAYWPALLAYSVVPDSVRVFAVVFLPGMCLGFVSEVLGNALLRDYMLPNDGVGRIVACASTVAAIALSARYGRRSGLALLVASCAISGMSLLTYLLFRFGNG